VVRAGAGHQFVGHVVDEDGVLVLFGVLMALVRDLDKSGASTLKENCSACAVLCPLGQRRRLQMSSYS
jgi:hypothetical protein